MHSNQIAYDSIHLVRNETESWMMTYEYEQRDATARVSVPMYLGAAILYGVFASASLTDITVSVFTFLALINFTWLIWRMFYDNHHTKSLFRITVISDQVLLVAGATLMVTLAVNDAELNTTQQLAAWTIYLLMGFQICDAVRSTPSLAIGGGVIHTIIAIASWKIAGYDEITAMSLFFIITNLYGVLHSIVRLDQIRGHARISIEQAICRQKRAGLLNCW
ncbi:MAG: hypothetical protein FJ146_16575 [Deltaproteobacteria bacterium]|nr:hypothetical protein [Deltaproteobacteria bacterium]